MISWVFLVGANTRQLNKPYDLVSVQMIILNVDGSRVEKEWGNFAVR